MIFLIINKELDINKICSKQWQKPPETTLFAMKLFLATDCYNDNKLIFKKKFPPISLI